MRKQEIKIKNLEIKFIIIKKSRDKIIQARIHCSFPINRQVSGALR